MHIVAPPGSGKTIIGLQIISQFKCPSLVLSPTTTIQAQWVQKLTHFFPPDYADAAVSQMIGTHEDRPLKPITALTYQVLSVPGRETEYVSELARQEWIREIAGKSVSADEARNRIAELKENNPKAYKKELGRHMTRLRRRLSDVLVLDQVLHENALQLIDQLKQKGCRLVIFDECHHLTDYWAAVMAQIVDYLGDVTIVGLTGTPPEKKSAGQHNRYLKLVGAIDYQVPTPALVKEGGLAPFQDLVYFTEPTELELEFLRQQHKEIRNLLQRLSQSELSQWVSERMAEKSRTGWKDFVEESPALALAMARYLYGHGLELPPDLEFSASVRQSPLLDDWIAILEDYALNKLKTSEKTEDHDLLDDISKAIRKIGFGLSERGIRKIASPVDRVLSFSRSKVDAAAQILDTEYRSLEERLRALIITDFEKLSATASASVKNVLDEEAGSASGALTQLLNCPQSQFVNPCLVTGTKVLIDARIADTFLEAASDYLAAQQEDITLTFERADDQPFVRLKSQSGKFGPRVYVGLVTALFERGITKCLIGTRGIFGEGWDCQKLNTIIDLTTSTSPVSVKQLRGRGIRLSADDPLAERKVANNWDVVCIAPELEKGLNDYMRFVRKHAGYFGIADDGKIECGVGHVHPSFSELTANEVFASIDEFNTEMLGRALVREKIYELWQVGKPYENKQLGCVEVSGLRQIGYRPPHVRASSGQTAHVKQLKRTISAVWAGYGIAGLAASGAASVALASIGGPMVLAVIPLLISFMVARQQLRKMAGNFMTSSSQESELMSIATAVVVALKQRKFVPQDTSESSIKITIRTDNSFRAFLDDVETRYSDLFVRCFEEVLAPVSNQPYVIAKYEYNQSDIEDPQQFFASYVKGEAQPKVACYHPLPRILARSEKGRDAFESAWNSHVSPGFVTSTSENPAILKQYFGMGPSLAERLLWE